MTALRPNYRRRAAHALRQAKKAFVSSLPSIAARKSSKSTPAYCAARNERKKSRTSFGSRPSWRLAQRWARPRQHRARRQAALPHTRQRQRRSFARRKLSTTRRGDASARGTRACLRHRLAHSGPLVQRSHLDWRCIPPPCGEVRRRAERATLGWGHRAEAAKRVRDPIPPTPTPQKCVVGPPRGGEVWSLLRRFGHADMLLRCRDAFSHPEFARPHPSRRAFGPPQDEKSFPPNGLRPKGWRAEKRNPMASRSRRRSRGRLSARHMRSSSACLFAVTCGPPGRAFADKCPAYDPRAVSDPSLFLRSKSASGDVIAGVWLGPYGRQPAPGRVS
jgi:hypothetical protein